MLDEMFQQNASKFAILYYWNTETHGCFSFFLLLYFFSNVCLGLCQHRQGHSLGEKIKLYKLKNATLGFCINNGKFWRVSLELFFEHKPWNWEEWQLQTGNYALLSSSKVNKQWKIMWSFLTLNLYNTCFWILQKQFTASIWKSSLKVFIWPEPTLLSSQRGSQSAQYD